MYILHYELKHIGSLGSRSNNKQYDGLKKKNEADWKAQKSSKKMK